MIHIKRGLVAAAAALAGLAGLVAPAAHATDNVPCHSPAKRDLTDPGSNHAWLNKVRPYWGHDYHFHVRIKCPADSPECKPQEPVPAGEGCGHELDWWFTESVLHPKPSPTPSKPRPPMTLADLPPLCRAVVLAP